MSPPILESLFFPAVIQPDPQHGAYRVLERYKLEGNYCLDPVVNLGLNSSFHLTLLVFVSQGVAVIFPLKEAEAITLWIKDCFEVATVDLEGLSKGKCAML